MFFPCESKELWGSLPMELSTDSQLSKSVRWWEVGTEVRHRMACSVGVSKLRLSCHVQFIAAPNGPKHYTILESSTIGAEFFPLDHVVGFFEGILKYIFCYQLHYL